MSKDKDDKFSIISKNDYIEELEAKVQYETARVMATNPFMVNKKYTHIEIPEFGDDHRARLDWELEEIRRCREGYDGMPGRYYFYFNHCWIRHKTRGKIRPDFRATQMDFARVKQEVLDTPGEGLVNIKRRQIGASWDFSADNVYDATFHKEYEIGMNSKSETDSRNLFSKHKYIHRNVSPFLRAYVHIDRRDAMVFGRWVESQKKHIGNMSSIISVAPTPTGHAGNAYAKLVIDEAGEQEELMSLWSNAEECLMDNDGSRVGTPFIFGTMGETGKAGKGLMEFWTKAHLYGLRRYALWGFSCMHLDSFGNDMIEEGIRSIIYERRRKEGMSSIVYNKFRQKWPITEEDAFLIVNGVGVGNPITRSNRYKELQDNPPLQVKGWMRPKIGGSPDFVPDPDGKIIVYERPRLIKNGYCASFDPADDDDATKSRDNSNLSTAIMARPFGLEGPKIVAEYTDRPKKLGDYYEQLAMLLQWYNNTQVLIEMNRGGYRAKDYFENHQNKEYAKLLSLAPKSPTLVQGGFKMEVGEKMTPARKQQMIGLLDAYWENYPHLIPSLRFIEECGKFGMDHADDDLAVAVGWCLLLLQADHRVASHHDAEASKNPTTQYRNVGGRIELINNGSTLRPTVKSTNPLFNR